MLREIGAGTTVVLTANRERALKLRKTRARDSGGGLERNPVSLPSDVISDAWALAGDGRAFVTRAQREALVAKLLGEQDLIARTPGAVRAVASFLQRYAGALARSSREAVRLSDAESAILILSDAYDEALEDAGLVESGEAALLLSDFDDGARFVFDEPVDMPVEVRRYILARRAEGVPGDPGFPERDGEGEPSFSLPEGVTATFSFPAGFEAVLSALRAELMTAGEDGGERLAAASCAVVTPRAEELFEMTAGDLSSAGATVRLRSSVAFRRTDFGRAMMSALDLVRGGGSWRVSAVDFAYSAFSGMMRFEARSFDRSLRADRLMTCVQAVDALSEASPSFPWFAALSSGFDSDAFARVERFLTDGSSVASRDFARERSALRAYSAAVADVLSVGGAYGCAFDHLESCAVSLDCVVPGEGGGGAYVLMAPPSASDAFVAGEFDRVVVGDVSERAYRAPSHGDALDALAGKLGITCSFDGTDAVRRRFARAVGAARDRVVCVFPLRDAAGDAAYPAFFIDEFVASLPGFDEAEAYESDYLGLPSDRVAGASRLGEDDLARCVGLSSQAPGSVETFPVARRGRLSHGDVLRGMKTVDAGQGPIAVLSPSAIEAYLACPYRWFVERRLRPEPLDECFGAAEKGTFVHTAFARLFDSLADRGVHRIGASELPLAHEVLDEVLERLVAEQPGRADTRLVARTRTEELEVERLREQIHLAVDRLALLPSDYDVLCHERALTVEDGVDYAGARLIGRVDRVDVNEGTRRFAVLDYKGASSGYAAGLGEGETFDEKGVPSKIQTLVYAQALRSQLDGFSCSAALYLGYRARTSTDFAAGSYDAAAYDASAVTRKASRVEMNFDRYLDWVEDALRPTVANLTAGLIPCEPRSKDACTWCPYERCERRA